MKSTPIHALRPSEVYSALETSPDGLMSGEVPARLGLYGTNTLPEPPALPPWRRIVMHVAHPMALVLWVTGLLALLAGHLTLPWIIWFVVIINAGFSYWQEYRAERAMAVLVDLLPRHTRVARDGQETMIPTSQIVPGDVLVLAQGDNIPADARVVEQYGLRINQATLTGEAIALPKTDEASLREGLTDLERPNLVFAGSSVVSGTGRAVVFETGSMTQFGRIARLTQAAEETPSPLQQEIARLTRILSIGALGLAVIVFAVGITDVGLRPAEAFILAIGILVAALPEGLRPTLTLSLAIAAQRLAGRGVLIKKLATLETLGRVSVVCTDKSGTLTHNQMTVREMWVSGRRLKVSGSGYGPVGSLTSANGGLPPDKDIQTFLTAAALCNNARLIPPGPDHPDWGALGDQTEAALRVCALKGQKDAETLAKIYPRIHELPFEATRRLMSTIHRNGQGEIAFVKGAPKEVLQQSTHILLDGEERPLDDEMRQRIVAANDAYAHRALKVLALAQRKLSSRQGAYTPETVERCLTFLGLAAMMDPPRPEVAAAIKTFRGAGIRVVIITGDYGLTAESMARRLGMLSSQRPLILTGSDIDEMSDAELQTALEQEVLFARVAPEHKLRVVAAFQTRGEVVAVSGDGVNDGPALRKADIGVAMGRSGTDVAREAADIILIHDNFGAIASAIEEGRAVFQNIRKFITYILASNVPEILPFVMTTLFNLPLALGVAQILAIDLGTDLLPALALGSERPEPDVMAQPPRSKSSRLVDQGLVARSLWLGALETFLCYAGFFAIYLVSGHGRLIGLPDLPVLIPFAQLALSPDAVYVLATTTFFAGVVMGQVGSAFTSRRETAGVHRLGWFSNPLLLAGIACEVVLALLLIYWPPLASLFGHLPLPPVWWLVLVSYGPILYVMDWVRKRVAVRFRRHKFTAHS